MLKTVARLAEETGVSKSFVHRAVKRGLPTYAQQDGGE